MKVILTKDLDNLGRAGALVDVKTGYGRNYLLPRNLAVLHRSMRIAAGMHVLLADGRQRTSLCRAGADPIRDHPVHRLVIGVPRFLL